MPEFEYAKGRIAETIGFILEEIKEFELDYSAKTWQDYQADKKLQKLVDRTIENILTAFIELCGTIVTIKGIQAENYGDVVKKCAKFYHFSESQQNDLAKLAVQRNRLAHRYLDFRWQAAKTFIQQKDLMLQLLNLIFEGEKKLNK
jgi:uncharacterized protein YutE (UPF0331/DUF86 family)